MTRVCEPVFVVGMNGSGTSMMLDSLGRHPHLYAVPVETLMMPYIIGKAAQFGDLSIDANYHRYWQFAIDQMPALRRVTAGRKLEIPANWRTYPRTIEGVFDGIFSSFAREHGKQRWCEKTPDHVQHLRMLSQVFPQAKFIHLLRDGREVACSINRRQFRRPELIIYRWKKLVNLGQAEGQQLGDRYTELKYEDLTSDPRRHMTRICAFLNLEFSEQVVLSRMPQSPGKKRLATGKLGNIGANPLKWPDFFKEVTLGRLEQIAGVTLTTLGYSASNQRGNRDPNVLTRNYWRAVDFLRLTRARMKTAKSHNSWRKVAHHAIYSFKQFLTKRH